MFFFVLVIFLQIWIKIHVFSNKESLTFKGLWPLKIGVKLPQIELKATQRPSSGARLRHNNLNILVSF